MVFDNAFTTVPNAKSGGIINTHEFYAAAWRQIVESGLERFIQDPDPDPGPGLDWRTNG